MALGVGTKARRGLRETVLEWSESEDWGEGQLEWGRLSLSELSKPFADIPGHVDLESDRCVCGQPLMYKQGLYNRYNGNVLYPVGKNCVFEHFSNQALRASFVAGIKHMKAVSKLRDGDLLDLWSDFSVGSLDIALEEKTVSSSTHTLLVRLRRRSRSDHFSDDDLLKLDRALRVEFADAIGATVMDAPDEVVEAGQRMVARQRKQQLQREARLAEEKALGAWLRAEQAWLRTPEGRLWRMESDFDQQRLQADRQKRYSLGTYRRLGHLWEARALTLEDFASADVDRAARDGLISVKERDFLVEMLHRHFRMSGRQRAWASSIVTKIGRGAVAFIRSGQRSATMVPPPMELLALRREVAEKENRPSYGIPPPLDSFTDATAKA